MSVASGSGGISIAGGGMVIARGGIIVAFFVSRIFLTGFPSGCTGHGPDEPEH
jgi:hypothetical protein